MFVGTAVEDLERGDLVLVFLDVRAERIDGLASAIGGINRIIRPEQLILPTSHRALDRSSAEVRLASPKGGIVGEWADRLIDQPRRTACTPLNPAFPCPSLAARPRTVCRRRARPR